MSLSRPLVRTAIVGATVALTALGLSPLASADDLEGTRYYEPTENGHEAILTKRLAAIRSLLKRR